MPNYPFFNEITLDRHSEVALYIQLSNNLARLIKRGILKPGFKLPGTRTIASHLAVNRNTVVVRESSYEISRAFQILRSSMLEMQASKPRIFVQNP